MDRQKVFNEWKFTFTLLVSLLAFRSMAWDHYHIPSGSMKPTLHIGDFVLVDKAAYGWKVPFSEYLERPVFMGGSRLPERGDVIVFKSQTESGINLIKRVIALPGDSVAIVDGQVYINDVPVPLTFKSRLRRNGLVPDRHVYHSRTGGADHHIQLNRYGGFIRDMPKRTVPPGKLFVLGDNRDNSSDSRVWGFVPAKDVKGKAKMVWMHLELPWDQPTEKTFDPKRIGKVII